MQHSAGGVDTDATIPPPAPPPATARSRGVTRSIVATFSYLRRRVWRVLAIFALLVLISLAVAAIGFSLRINHEQNAAGRAVARGHNMAAVRHLMFCRRFRPDHPEILLLSARVARRSGAWTEAEAILDRYTEMHGDDDDLALERLSLRASRGELEGAAPLLEVRIREGGPAATLASEALAAGLLYRYRLNDAGEHIARWLERESDSTLALIAKGKLHEQRDQNTAAVLTYQHILDLDPEYDEVRMRLTTNLLLSSRGEEALAHLHYLHGRLPDHPQIVVQLGQALDATGRTDQALAVLDLCVGRDPDHADALAERGRIARVRGDAVRAEADLFRATRFDPGNAIARYQYYLTLVQNGKSVEAAKEQEAIRQIQTDVERIKQILHGRLQDAPNDPTAPYEIAMIALRAGRPKEALRWLQNALQVGPEHVPTHRTLAALYHETGNPILSARHRAIAQRLSSQ